MPSQIGWIDFSPEHRDKVASVIDLLKGDITVDELGIGIIRNAISDLLFPGISTVQTRAKYFFLIPYMIKDYALLPERERNKLKLSDYLRSEENELIWRLSEKYSESDELGIIGITMTRGQELARKPSSIYWNGIRTHHLIETYLPLNEYLDGFDNMTFNSLQSMLKGDDCIQDDLDACYEDRFMIKVPYQIGWNNAGKLDIHLTHEEADYLKNRFIDYHSDKLLGQIWKNRKITRNFLKANDFEVFCELPIINELPSATHSTLIMAYDFNYIMHGSHIRYNCILQNRFGTPGKFEDHWDEWIAGYPDAVFDLKGFQTEELISLAASSLPLYTKQFVRHWIDSIQKKNFDVNYLDGLVTAQEKSNKGGKARLRVSSDETINEWIGLDGLNYRYPVAQKIVRDVMDGLDEHA